MSARQIIKNKNGNTMMNCNSYLFSFLHRGVVEAKVDIVDKTSLLSHISEKFARETEIAPIDILERAFWKRERVQNTAIGRGVAMPHAVLPDVAQIIFGIFTLRQPIDFWIHRTTSLGDPSGRLRPPTDFLSHRTTSLRDPSGRLHPPTDFLFHRTTS